MAFTAADLTAVQTAIAKGELRVDFADRSVTYRSVSELLQAEARIERAIASAAMTERKKQFLCVGSKGF